MTQTSQEESLLDIETQALACYSKQKWLERQAGRRLCKTIDADPFSSTRFHLLESLTFPAAATPQLTKPNQRINVIILQAKESD